MYNNDLEMLLSSHFKVIYLIWLFLIGVAILFAPLLIVLLVVSLQKLAIIMT